MCGSYTESHSAGCQLETCDVYSLFMQWTTADKLEAVVNLADQVWFLCMQSACLIACYNTQACVRHH